MTGFGFSRYLSTARVLWGLALFAAAMAASAHAQQFERQFGTLAKGRGVERDIAYGSMAEQRMDVYLPPNAQRSPIIIMVHGGAWAFGSKSAPGVVDNKVAHWLPKGFIFVSVETRLAPAADPVEQATDVAAAMAMVQRRAASWGGDPSKMVLMGHSAGAHLVALVSADRSIAQKASVKPWAGTIALDSAAYDVSSIMERPNHPRFYDQAFGSDPRFWKIASPTFYAGSNMPRMLLVCSSLRSDSCPQANAFARKSGEQARVLSVSLRHMAINRTLGLESDYTRQVDAFINSIVAR